MVLLDALVIKPRSVLGPLSPQSVTLTATQLNGAARAKILATQAASGLRRASARAHTVESDMALSPRVLLAPRVYATGVERT